MPTKKKSYTYPYPRPSVTVDLVAFTFRDGGIHALVVQRKSPPFEGMLAFPGGFLNMDEEPVVAVARETHEETGLVLNGPVIELGFFGAVDRDPRGRTISLVHVAIARAFVDDPIAGDDAAAASWEPLDDLLASPLAFDHAEILADATRWLERVLTTPAALSPFLPEVFVETDVQDLMRCVRYSASDAAEWCDYAIEQGLCRRMPGHPKHYESLLIDATELRRGELTI
jgi:8-oxo-dGTP diphosphatase